MNITLKRVASSKVGTFGVLIRDNIPLCVTLERPWNDNKTGDSCIPTGTYKCIQHNGTQFKGVWEITNVPNRTAILFHAGNTIKDTHGCVLVGSKFSPAGVSLSQAALDDLRHTLPGNFTLTIKEI